MKEYFEGIDGLVKKDNLLYIDNNLFGTFFPDDDFDKNIFRGAIEVKNEDKRVIRELESKSYLLIYNHGPCRAR